MLKLQDYALLSLTKIATAEILINTLLLCAGYKLIVKIKVYILNMKI